MTATSDMPSISIPNENTTIVESYCSTDFKMHKYKREWTINNFKLFQKKLGETLISHDTKCVLYLYPNGINSGYFVSLSVELKSKQRFEETNIMCCILNAKKEKIQINNSKNNSFPRFHNFCERNFIFDEANCLLPEGKLTILCEISLLIEEFSHNRESNIVQKREPDCTLRKNLEDVLVNERFCDVTFAVGDREIRAHKVILAAHSDVFAAMFEHKMKENVSNRVTIEDVDFNVFKEMLYFIYSGKAPNLNEMAHDLFAAADKYNLKTLKMMCEKAMSAKLSVTTADEHPVETAIETLILADRHFADELKAQSIDFVIKHMKEVKTEAWLEMIITHPHLVSDIFQELAENHLNKQTTS